MENQEEVNFTVDAGIINRLGLELVSRQETAVSELIKNGYDADANKVKVTFLNASHDTGGTLKIEDDGLGMNKEELKKGFLRLATTDKLHKRVSIKHHRIKAGKKGIGRFATQRLGKKLIIITQIEDENTAWKLTINWEDYSIDKELNKITNTLEKIEKQKKHGTLLIIEDLRDIWNDVSIKRIYRYVSELIQPNLLKINNSEVIAESKDESFEVNFWRNNDKIVDEQMMIFDKAIYTISGYVDDNGYTRGRLESKKFGINENFKAKEVYSSLVGGNIAFKVYYYITENRLNYYQNITKPELNAIKDYLSEKGGIKLYRNGFKVSPYGDKGNDWLSIASKSRIGGGVPFTNKNLVGFVQITDDKGLIFEEVAGREGLIEGKAFEDLKEVIESALVLSFRNFVSLFKKSDEYEEANQRSKETVSKSTIEETIKNIKEVSENITSDSINQEEKEKAQDNFKETIEKLIQQTNALADEAEMLRVLAGLGLNIGEFIHEIKQFQPSFDGYLKNLLSRSLGTQVDEMLKDMQRTFSFFDFYTSYFDVNISQNVLRELKPIDLRDVVYDFSKIIETDLEKRNIKFDKEFSSKELIIKEMHPSEWSTILQNLYSNAKKAIYRIGRQGKILIKCFTNEKSVFLSFYDNGDGIAEKYIKTPERIFYAFDTTSPPVTSSKNLEMENTGSGLGLYIVRQIIINRNGKIWIDKPTQNFTTCFTIELPKLEK